MNNKELKSELESKNELVQALTLQLEQAAEQLDRLQRTGVRASTVGSGGSLPAEFAEQQEAAAQNIEYLVEQWDAAQVAGSIGRVEMQLEELRDLITELVNRPVQTTTAALREQTSTETVSELDAEASHADLLDSLQAAFLQSPEQIPETVLEEVPEDFRTGSSNGMESSEITPNETEPLAEPGELPELPEKVDFDSATKEELCDAIISRDEYIKTVVDHLSAARKQFGIQSPDNWEDLQECPQELIEKVQQLEQQLEDQLRLGEVSLSLERARLSREETQLNLAKIQIQKELRKQGIDPQTIPGLESNPESAETPAEDKTKGTKWLNMLRINND